MTISRISGLQVIDSRGNPTVRAYVTLNDGSIHSSSSPSGASVGVHEAKELRDGDQRYYLGLGVLKAVENINTHIHKALVGRPIDSIKMIDEILLHLDQSPNKSIIGANAMLAVSQAAIKACAYKMHEPVWSCINKYYFPETTPSFPRLFLNVINGGRHANWTFDIQEFIVVPKKNIPSQSIRIGVEIFQSIKKELTKRGLSTLVGDEGGESPQLSSNDEVFELIIKSALAVKYSLGVDFEFGIDAAASQIYSDNIYTLKKDNLALTWSELQDRYETYIDRYHVKYFEDPFAEDDWSAFENFSNDAKGRYVVIGDDLFATNLKRTNKGVTNHSAGGIIIKPNQIGTILETVEVIRKAQSAKWLTIISHRSGDTEDTFIADLAYGCGADFIKTGSMSRSERLTKYNRLLEIEAFEQ